MMIEFLEFTSRDEASDTLSEHLSRVITHGVSERDEVALVVSGGSTPKPMFQMLGERDLPWERVTLVPSDERRVPLDHPDSNEAMIRRELTQGRASTAQVFSYQDVSACMETALANINRRLSQLPLPFDAVVLGMGDDGHTASLFPDAPDIENALGSEDLCIFQEIPRLSAPRLSLTVKALLNSRTIDLLFFGEEKRRVYEQACESGPPIQYPVRAVLHQSEVPVNVWWAP